MRNAKRYVNNKNVKELKVKKSILEKNSGIFMKMLLIILFITVMIFTTIMIIIYVYMGSVPDILIDNFFTFFSVEGGACGIIKVAKVTQEWLNEKRDKKKVKDRENDDEEEEEDPLEKLLNNRYQ